MHEAFTMAVALSGWLELQLNGYDHQGLHISIDSTRL